MVRLSVDLFVKLYYFVNDGMGNNDEQQQQRQDRKPNQDGPNRSRDDPG
jgi:hypothetical protein